MSARPLLGGLTSWGHAGPRAWQAARAALVVAVAAVLASFVAAPISVEPRVVHPQAGASRKGTRSSFDVPLLATLVDTHSPTRLALDDISPGPSAFEGMLKDPVMGSVHALDPELLRLLRAIARVHPLSRIEIVSGFRSPKLNEQLRKKGHHVASHSQHSLGHAVDFRVVPEDAEAPMDPRDLAAEVRAYGWVGGIGIYSLKGDRFVHADVGPLRSW